jgi:multiple sugar transport system permease protein/raffinose/stachyose/melibiose transport system permease protein
MATAPHSVVQGMSIPARKGRRRFSFAAYAFVAPAILLLGIFNIYPLFQGILLSLREWDGVNPVSAYVGLDNYARVLGNDVFRASLLNALKFGVVGLLGGGSLGLIMALAVHTKPRGMVAFRAIYFLPWILSVVVVGFLFGWLLDPAVGPLNRVLDAIGLGDWTHAWLAEPETAFPTLAAVYIWGHWGIGFLLFLAGLQNVPTEVLEAAVVDGAGPWTRFRDIVFPLLMPVTAVVSVITLLLALQIFGTILVTTNGGPGYHTEVPTLQIYKESFQFFRFGIAAAMSVVFGIVLVAVSLGQLWLSRRYGQD